MENQNTFLVDAVHEGGLATFEVTPDNGILKIYYAGELMAEIKHDGSWEKLSGEYMPAHILQQIVAQIDEHYKSL